MLTAASVAVALAAADTYVVVLALTDMMTGVGIGIDSLQRATPIISGFLLGYIAVLPLIGRLSDLIDRQRVLLGCLVVFVLGSAVTALSVDLGVLVGGRVLQGIGGGGLVPATLALVADLWPVERRGVPLGVVGAVQEAGSVIGPVLGAVILAIADWRAIFWANAVGGVVLGVWILAAAGARPRLPSARTLAQAALAVLGVGALLLALAAPTSLVTDVTLGVPFVPFGGTGSRLATPLAAAAVVLILTAAGLSAPRWLPPLRRADLPGAVLLGLALGSVVLTFAEANPEREVVGSAGYALLPVAVVSGALYLWRQARASEPLVPRGVVTGRARVALLASLLTGSALVAIVVDVPLLARLTGAESQTAAALVLVRFLLAVPVGAILGGWLLSRVGEAVVGATGLAAAAVALGLMSRWGADSLEQVVATLVLVLAGLGIGLALAPVNSAALAAAPPGAHGAASGLVVVARMVGMVLGLALLTAVGLRRYYQAVATLPDPTDAAALVGAGIVQVQTVFLGAAALALLGAVAALGLGRSRA